MALSGLYRTAAILLLSLTVGISLFAASFDQELHHRIINTTESTEPYISDDVIMLSYSAPPGTQVVALALESEDYRIFHKYEKNRHGVFVLAMPLPENYQEIRYRLIVDGLWTVDPKTSIVRDKLGVRVSHVSLPVSTAIPTPGIKELPDGSTRFVYYGNTGSRVNLVGDFNRWDPFLTPMEESPVYPGIFVIALNLPSESSHYRYVVDGNEITDPDNPASSRNLWGETASIIR